MSKQITFRIPERIIKYLDEEAVRVESNRTATLIKIIDEYRVRQEVKRELRVDERSATND